jgi:hypothetical protein
VPDARRGAAPATSAKLHVGRVPPSVSNFAWPSMRLKPNGASAPRIQTLGNNSTTEHRVLRNASRAPRKPWQRCMHQVQVGSEGPTKRVNRTAIHSRLEGPTASRTPLMTCNCCGGSQNSALPHFHTCHPVPHGTARAGELLRALHTGRPPSNNNVQRLYTGKLNVAKRSAYCRYMLVHMTKTQCFKLSAEWGRMDSESHTPT